MHDSRRSASHQLRHPVLDQPVAERHEGVDARPRGERLERRPVEGRLDGDQREVEVAVELVGRAHRVERDGVLRAGLLVGQAGLAQQRDMALVGVEHDDPPDRARELGRRDPADRAAADDEHARVDHRRRLSRSWLHGHGLPGRPRPKRSVSGHREWRIRTRTLVFLTTAGRLPARTLTRAAIVTALRLRMRAAPFLFRRTTSLAFAPGAILVLSVPTRVTDAAAARAPAPGHGQGDVRGALRARGGAAHLQAGVEAAASRRR